MTELTEQQRVKRRKQARDAINARLKETWSAWRRLGRKPNFALAADLAVDSLGDLAVEILADGTLLKALTIENGVATLETEPARELFLVLVASMREMLDSYGAENYLEAEITAPSVSMDVCDGQNPRDAYTVTIQRRTRPTPHEFRQRAELERDDVLRIVSDWCVEANKVGGVDVGDLAFLLERAGHPLPETEVAS